MQQGEGLIEREVRGKKGIKKRKKEAVLTMRIAIQIQYSIIIYFLLATF